MDKMVILEKKFNLLLSSKKEIANITRMGNEYDYYGQESGNTTIETSTICALIEEQIQQTTIISDNDNKHFIFETNKNKGMYVH